MGQAGLFDEDARVELLDGQVTQMAPIGDRHALCVNRLNRLFQVEAGDRIVVSVRNPVVLDDRSEPQPDLALLRPPNDRYTAHPRAEDVLLVVEVADRRSSMTATTRPASTPARVSRSPGSSTSRARR